MEKHFCTSVYIFNPENKTFLLIKHKKLGKWMQPGGHVEENEDPEECAIREVKEETGLDVELIGNRLPRDGDFICPLALQKNMINEEHMHMDFVYEARVIGGMEHINNLETDGMKWFILEEICNKDFNTFPEIKVWCKKIVGAIDD